MKVVEKRMEVVPIEKINGNPNNWKRHGRSQRMFLQSVFKEVGYITPVIWNEDTGNLIDGHLRVSELKASGEDSVEAVVVNLSSDDEMKVLSLMDKVAEKGAVDKERYEELIQSIVFDDSFLEEELKKVEKAVEDYGAPEYELVPEMLKNYHYILLVFKNEANFMSGRDLFGIDYKIDRYNGKKGMSYVADGDNYVEEART